METVEYTLFINAPQTKVWDTLWEPKSYAQWTQFFQPVFSLKTDWKVDGKTYFLEADGNGMVSTISSMNAPDQLIFQHLGMLKNGVEITKGPAVVEWSGVEEKYFLRTLDSGMTELRVIVHIYKKQREVMDAGFEKGLDLLKDLCES